MTATAKPRAARAAKAAEALPPAAPSLLLAPIPACTLCPKGRAGVVLIHGADYLISYHSELPEQGPPVVLGYRLVSMAGKVYDQPHDLLSCDCADMVYRQRACKHIVALAVLRQDGLLL